MSLDLLSQITAGVGFIGLMGYIVYIFYDPKHQFKE